LHVKAIDDAGHDKNLDVKIDQLEKVDAMMRILMDQLGSLSDENTQYIVCVTGDHTTPVV